MTGIGIVELLARLSDRDQQVVGSVEQYRLLTSRQLQRLHFDDVHSTGAAAARACNRTLAKLRDLDVLRALDRRIGGVRAGSAGFVWYLGPAGERIIDVVAHGGSVRGRRNYREPSRHFVEHTLAISDLAIQAIEASRHGSLEILAMETEPASWQPTLSRHGTPQWLKPDLHLVTANIEYEHHWFVELDLATEHLPVIKRQCQAYEEFRATGRYQAAHGLFPAVVWVTPSPTRAAALRGAVAATSGLDPGLFRVCTTNEYPAIVLGAEGLPR